MQRDNIKRGGRKWGLTKYVTKKEEHVRGSNKGDCDASLNNGLKGTARICIRGSRRGRVTGGVI